MPFYLPSLLYPSILSHLFSLIVYYVHVLYVVHGPYTRTVHYTCMLDLRRVQLKIYIAYTTSICACVKLIIFTRVASGKWMTVLNLLTNVCNSVPRSRPPPGHS